MKSGRLHPSLARIFPSLLRRHPSLSHPLFLPLFLPSPPLLFLFHSACTSSSYFLFLLPSLSLSPSPTPPLDSAFVCPLPSNLCLVWQSGGFVVMTTNPGNPATLSHPSSHLPSPSLFPPPPDYTDSLPRVSTTTISDRLLLSSYPRAFTRLCPCICVFACLSLTYCTHPYTASRMQERRRRRRRRRCCERPRAPALQTAAPVHPPPPHPAPRLLHPRPTGESGGGWPVHATLRHAGSNVRARGTRPTVSTRSSPPPRWKYRADRAPADRGGKKKRKKEKEEEEKERGEEGKKREIVEDRTRPRSKFGGRMARSRMRMLLREGRGSWPVVDTLSCSFFFPFPFFLSSC